MARNFAARLRPRGVRTRPRKALLVVENVALARDHRLRKQAASLVSAGYQVSVICRSDPANTAVSDIRLHEYRAPADATSKLGFVREYGYSWTMAAWLTLRAFVLDGFDVIQISGTPDIYFTIGAPFKLLGRRLVFDQRDLSPELYETRYRKRDSMYRVLCWLERTSYRTADHVITVNDSLKQIACTRARLPSQAVTVVRNGPVLARTLGRAPRPALKQGRRFLCCWLGLMGPQDQVELALQSIDHLVNDIGRTDCHFAFIGDGESRESACHLARELGIGEYVSFPGWLAEEDAFTYLSTADVGLEPNLEEIVSPVKGMEYMAFELPFVAFDLAETRTLARGAAAYADPGDAKSFARCVDELLDDPSRREHMGRIGRQRIENEIAWDHQQDTYLSVYRSLLDAHA
jgi:glycosyltransferase involved in cell wall biosynthesis